MIIYLFLFLSFAQMSLLGIGGNAGTQALLEHEVITLHHWITPEQLSNLMVFCRTIPGGTGLNAATLVGSLSTVTRFGFWGSLLASTVSVIGLTLPAALWAWIITAFRKSGKKSILFDGFMLLLRPLVPGLIAAAAILMMTPENFGSPLTHPWQFGVTVFLFLTTLIGTSCYRFNAFFMILICGIAGCILL